MRISDWSSDVCSSDLEPRAVYQAAHAAIARARAGDGPTLIEAMTFRFNGHLIGDMGEYIPKADYAAEKAADPYPRFRQWLQDQGHASDADLAAIDAAARQEIAEAEALAMSSAPPAALVGKRDGSDHEIGRRRQ